jgi:hypothetical protein
MSGNYNLDNPLAECDLNVRDGQDFTQEHKIKSYLVFERFSLHMETFWTELLSVISKLSSFTEFLPESFSRKHPFNITWIYVLDCVIGA